MSLDDSRIRVTQTPNPDAYMFHVSEALISSGTHEYYANSDTSDSPLAELILKNDGVELLLIASRFITVRKYKESGWDDLLDQVSEALSQFLDSGEMAVFEQADDSTPTALGPIEERILELLDEEIRPAIAQDGGDVVYHGFENGIVKLELIGACGTCPSSTATLKYGIQNLLMEEIPEVAGVEQV